MNGWDNRLTVILLIVSNIIAILQLTAAVRWPRIARISFFLLFAWAAWTNLKTSQQHADYYLDYANLAWSSWYVHFIRGWFALHIKTVVGLIAICQAFIAFSMLLKGWVYTAGCLGAMLFLLAILPLGTGAGFPCTAIMAVAVYIILKKNNQQYIWEKSIVIKKEDGNRTMILPGKSQYPV